MIILSGGTKGGSGKSTIVVNLAVMRASEKYEVLLVDADKQGTATDFSLKRQETLDSTSYTYIQLRGKAVRDEVLKLADKYDDIFIDVGGRDTPEQRSALAATDIFLVPFCPSSFDVWPLDQIDELLDDALAFNPDLKAFSFLNKADSRGVDNDEAIELAKESQHLNYLPALIGLRKVYRSAASQGLAVTEYKPTDKKAIDEMWHLYDAIFNPNSDIKRGGRRKSKRSKAFR